MGANGHSRTLEIFQCVRLDCWLTKEACAKRHVRAEAVKKNADGHWVPDQWAMFAASCRGCPIGAQHVIEVPVDDPERPGQNKPRWGRRKKKKVRAFLKL